MPHDMLPEALGLYVLDAQRRPVRAESYLAWGAFMEDPSRRKVARTDFADGSYLSTVFLACDTGCMPNRPVTMFESILFDAAGGVGFCYRFATWAEAETFHMDTAEAIQAVQDN